MVLSLVGNAGDRLDVARPGKSQIAAAGLTTKRPRSDSTKELGVHLHNPVGGRRPSYDNAPSSSDRPLNDRPGHRPGPGHDPGQAVQGQQAAVRRSIGGLLTGRLSPVPAVLRENNREQQESRYELASQKRIPIAEPNQMTRASRFCRAR